MAGYATGEVYFAAQALGFRHSHLDTGAYSYDQKHEEKDLDKAVNFLVSDETGRVFFTSMVGCLFSREVYNEEQLADCLRSVKYNGLADNMAEVSRNIQKLRWKTRVATGFRPEEVTIPKRFKQVVTWKGSQDAGYLDALQKAYAQRIREMAMEDESGSPQMG